MSQQVTLNCGFKTGERPISFKLNNRSFDIERMFECRINSQYDLYEIAATGGERFLLRRHRFNNVWEVDEL